VKYNRPNGEIFIECARIEDTWVRLSIRDTGYGIDPQQKDNLFKPFQRLGQEQGDIEGTGIGLVVTKKLIEDMNGRVGFNSTFNEGSTFWIDLPRSEAQLEKSIEKEEEHPVLLQPSQRSKTILYVEDNPANALLMSEVMRDYHHFDLHIVSTAEEGVTFLETHDVDLALLDVNLPGMSGVDMVRHLRGQEAYQDLHILMISANAMSHSIDEAISAGANGYLTKPLNLQKFTEIIMTIFNSPDKNDF